MDRFFYYIDYGSGFVLINPHKVDGKLSISRGELNDFISRVSLEGSISLISTEAQTAKTFFITNGNYEAPFKIYEHGISGVGTSVYTGWAKTKGVFDLNANTVTLDTFRTNDVYSDIIPEMGVSVEGERIPPLYAGFSVNQFNIQGLNSNCNKLQAYAWSGTAWVANGNTLSIPNVGRLAADNDNGSMVFYDNINKAIKRYTYTAPNWAAAATGTSLQLHSSTGNAALCSYSTNNIVFVDDYFHEIRRYQAVSSTWTLISSVLISELQFPSLTYVTNDGTYDIVALIDEGTADLHVYAVSPWFEYVPSINLGDIKKPSICLVSSLPATSVFAIADAGTQTIKAYLMSATNGITRLGDSISIVGVVEPVITHESYRVINLYDATTGILQKYTFSFTTLTWSLTGSSTSIGGGYSSAMTYDGTYLGILTSDSYAFTTRLATSYVQVVNGLLGRLFDFNNNVIMGDTGTGSTFDFSKLIIAALNTTQDISYNSEIENKEKFTLKEIFKLAELFQNYWYIDYDPVTGYDYQIKFIQPNLFSSVGSDVDLSAYTSLLNNRTYLDEFDIDKEDLNFQNVFNTDFEGDLIEYERNTPIMLDDSQNYSADAAYLQNSFLGINYNYELKGKMLLYGTWNFPTFEVEPGTGISGDTNVKNEKLSKSRIQDTYWKDYRYASTGNITINGVSSAVQSTCRRIIAYPDVDTVLSDFPSSIGSVNWGGGIKSFITELSVDLDSYIFTIKSIQLDL